MRAWRPKGVGLSVRLGGRSQGEGRKPRRDGRPQRTLDASSPSKTMGPNDQNQQESFIPGEEDGHQQKAEKDPIGTQGPQRDARQALGFDLLWQVLRVVCRGQRPRTQRGQAGYIREAGQLSVKSMVSGVRLPAPPLTGCVTLGKSLNPNSIRDPRIPKASLRSCCQE